MYNSDKFPEKVIDSEYIICWISILTLFILIDFPRHVDRTSMAFPFCILKSHMSKFLNSNIFLSLKIFCILTSNSADPDEIQCGISSGSSLFA